MFRFNGCIIKNILLIKNVYEIMLGQNHYSNLFSLVHNTNFHLKLWTEECHHVSNWSRSLWLLAVNCFFVGLNFLSPWQQANWLSTFAFLTGVTCCTTQNPHSTKISTNFRNPKTFRWKNENVINPFFITPKSKSHWAHSIL